MTDRLPQSPRSDARERILEATRTVVTTDGFDVPLRVIARRAGVGPAARYRRFRVDAALPEIARRAKQSGRLRTDFALDDMVLHRMAAASPAHRNVTPCSNPTDAARPSSWRCWPS